MGKEIKITRYGETRDVFEGDLLAKIADRQWPGQKGKELDIHLYKTNTGGYLLASRFRVSYPERKEFTGATRFNSAAEMYEFLTGEAKGLEENVDSLICQAAEKDEAFRLLLWGRECLKPPSFLAETGSSVHTP